MTINELIISNINFADIIAAKKKRQISNINYEDLQAAAYLGLVEAAHNYNKNKNTCFQAFAFFRINGAIRDYLRELSWGSRRRPIKMQDIKI